MRLAGLVHSSVVTGGEPVYVALRDLSVLLGPNDSGKSRTLGVLHLELALRESERNAQEITPPISLPEYDVRLFVALDEGEASVVCSDILRDLVEDDGASPAEYEGIGGRALTAYDRDWLEELAVDDHIYADEALATWLALLRRSAGLEASRFDPLFTALEQSRIALVADPLSDFEPSFLHLALDERVAGAEPIRSLLVELGLDGGGPGPVPVAPLGRVSSSFPSAMWVPQDPGAIYDELVGALRDCVGASADLESDDAPEDPMLVALDADGFRAEIAPALRALCGLVQMVVNDVLPDFVGERYWVGIEPTPITGRDAGIPVYLTIESRDGARRFALDDAAEGLQLWLQLALLEGVAALRGLAQRLYSLVLARDDGAPSDDGTAALETMAILAAQPARQGFEVHRHFRGPALELLQGETDLSALRKADLSKLFGGYCYFLDEPERHLHPRVARSAARWLRDRIGQSGAQCVLTTHSVPFLDLGEAAAYNYLRRDGDRVRSQSFDLDTLDALSVLAGEMGFDRGELLGGVETVLFVEGRNDQRVLEGLFARELRRAGVTVVPMQGVGRLHRAIEAEFLFRWTAASIRVLLDNDVKDMWPELKADPAALEEALRSKHTERQALAQLVKTARQMERDDEIEVHSIPAPDMFFMLDERVLTELHAAFPGHEQAEREWSEYLVAKQKIGRKAFRLQQYGVPDEERLYIQVAGIMRERGLFPPALVDVVRRL